jgi:hypothetical protein
MGQRVAQSSFDAWSGLCEQIFLPIPPRAAGGRRPITLLFAKTADLDGVREALVARRTAAWLGDDLWGDESYLGGLWNGAVTVETPTIARKPGAAPAIRLRNTSAVPMRLVVRDAPAWFVLTPPLQLEARAVTFLRPGFTAEAPTGEHRMELRLEVSNLHVGPGRNLIVTIPLTITNH